MGFWRRLSLAVRGYDTRIDAFEEALIGALAARVAPDAASRLLARAKAINRVQRLFGGSDTTFYQMSGGRPIFPPETALLDYPETVRFARCRIRSEDPLTRLKCTVFLHAGNLSSMEFDRPTKFARADAIKEVQVEFCGPPFVDPDKEERAAGEWPAP